MAAASDRSEYLQYCIICSGLSFCKLTRFSAPTYLSSRSADVILSDVRPTKLKGEALRSINVFLDELLWLILSTARSFSTERLKSGLLKILPTPLGKEALLEAEVELRAYWERTNLTNPSIPRSSSDDSTQDFPLQPAFEVTLFASQISLHAC